VLQRCPEETKVEGPTRFNDAALALLCDGEYEGNVRELVAVVQYGYLMARAAGAGEIGVEHVPEGLCPVLRYERRGDVVANGVAIERALRRTGGNVTQAAKLLGISRNRLSALLAKKAN
jgi:DNA-binding NtrC family response regulator